MRALRRCHRGIALISALLAIVLVMALLAVMVDIGSARLRQINESLRAEQALAAADSGASWVRALFAQHHGDLRLVLADLASVHSRSSLWIDSGTSADVVVSVQLPGATKHADHLDINLQENPGVNEAPVQVVATATVSANGETVATRTVTTLLRSFALAPYSEVVGVIDDAGLASSASPGDPAGQLGGDYATDLRIRAFVEAGTGSPVPADHFSTDSWSDGNLGSPGILP